MVVVVVVVVVVFMLSLVVVMVVVVVVVVMVVMVVVVVMVVLMLVLVLLLLLPRGGVCPARYFYDDFPRLSPQVYHYRMESPSRPIAASCLPNEATNHPCTTLNKTSISESPSQLCSTKFVLKLNKQDCSINSLVPTGVRV